MAGRGFPAKEDRVNRMPLAHELAVAAPGVGWQHGAVPDAPDGLMAASLVAWSTWFGAWFASFWCESDVPGLRQLVRLYDEVERGEFQRSTELRMMMDTYGVTPKGQQDRRWKPPVEPPKVVSGSADSYAHLRAV